MTFRVMRLAILLLLTLFSGCLNVGCRLMTAEELGASHPKLIFRKSLWGLYGEAGGNFIGDVDMKYDPTTGQLTLTGKIASDVSNVVKAEGERMDHMVAIEALMEKRLEHLDDAVTADIKAITDITASLAPVFTAIAHSRSRQPPMAATANALLDLWGALPPDERAAFLTGLGIPGRTFGPAGPP